MLALAVLAVAGGIRQGIERINRLLIPFLGLIIFALGGNPAAGPQLAFITLPQIFLQMPAGYLVGAVFFFLLCTAAATSMIALLEIPVAALTHRMKLRRAPATLGMGLLVFLIGLPSALSFGVLGELRIGSLGILDAIDSGVSNFVLPVIGIGTALYVGWGLRRATALAESELGDGRLGRAWLWLVRAVVPVMTLLILLQATGLF
jgi:NSS family neurotransmitter:Na+ symporter